MGRVQSKTKDCGRGQHLSGGMGSQTSDGLESYLKETLGVRELTGSVGWERNRGVGHGAMLCQSHSVR